jgi:carboxymethylenebutenolidase
MIEEWCDMRGATVEVPTPDGVADAYLVQPDGDGSYPGVLLYMDAFGLRPRLEEMADRIAARGYRVLVPNLFYRGGRAPLVDLSGIADPERRGEIFGQIMPYARELTPERIARDSQSYLDFLAPGASVAMVGYCMGALNALRTMEAHPDRVYALAGFHGARLATDDPDSPHLGVGVITGELYLAYADDDPSMPAEQIAKLDAALDAAGVTHTSEVYAGAPHGFSMSDTAAYDEEAEKRHWVNLFALLERTAPAR